jgi:hypothetical protein
MSLDAMRSIVREMVDRLAREDYESLIQHCSKSRLTSDDLRSVVHDYGRKLVSPPSDAYKDLDSVEVNSATVPKWSIRAPVWTREEGQSDLTLELTITLGPGEPSVELDDVHVL